MDVELTAEAKDKQINRLVALSVVIFSVAVGLGNIKDGNIVQAMAQAQANSLDRWNEYQATRTKLHIVETAREQLATFGDAQRTRDALAGFDAQVAKYKSESPKLAKEAQGFSDQYDALNVHDDQFDASDAAIGIAVAIAAVAALADSFPALVVAWLFGAFGVVMGLAGFFGLALKSPIASLLS